MAGRFLRVALALGALAGVGGCGPETSTSYSSTHFLQWGSPGEASRLVPYQGTRLFSEDNRNYRLRALGCEFDVRYDLGASPADDTARAEIEEARLRLMRSGASVQFAGLLVSGRMVADPDAVATLPCDTNSDTLVFVGARGPMDGGRAPTAFVRSTRTGMLWAFTMKPDSLTPGQEAEAREKATGFALEVFKAWATG